MSDKSLFMDKFKQYSSKDGEEGRVVEDFEGLLEAIHGDLKHRLNAFLGGTDLEEVINNHELYASSDRGQHERKNCIGFIDKKANDQEERICKCMYYYKRKIHSLKMDDLCFRCQNNHKWYDCSNQFEIIDYQFPMPYAHKIMKKRNVDLVLRNNMNGEIYAVEVKDWDSKDSLSRMMAETLTYTTILESAGENGMKDGKILLPAIAFFEKSIQHTKYLEYKRRPSQEFLDLLKEIKIFIIIPTDGEGNEREFVFSLT